MFQYHKVFNSGTHEDEKSLSACTATWGLLSPSDYHSLLAVTVPPPCDCQASCVCIALLEDHYDLKTTSWTRRSTCGSAST